MGCYKMRFFKKLSTQYSDDYPNVVDENRDIKIDFNKKYIVFVKEKTLVEDDYTNVSRGLYCLEVKDRKPVVVYNVYLMDKEEIKDYIYKYGIHNIMYVSENKSVHVETTVCI